VVGYKVIDAHYGEVGILEAVIDFQVNPLIQILNNGAEVLIPLREGLVKKLDRKNKIMNIEAPEGLIELYLG
jgi:16S rRNA processing protein RimM